MIRDGIVALCNAMIRHGDAMKSKAVAKRGRDGQRNGKEKM